MDFLHTLGHDEGFWVGMAAVQAALMIALVVEGGTVREAWHAAEERLDVDLDERATQAEAAWAKQAQDERTGIAPLGEGGSAPPLVLPRANDPNQAERAGRVLVAILAIPLLAVGLVCSLFAMSPIGYPGAILMVFGAMTSSASTLFAVWALTLLAVRRLTGRTVRALVAEWRSGRRLH